MSVFLLLVLGPMRTAYASASRFDRIAWLDELGSDFELWLLCTIFAPWNVILAARSRYENVSMMLSADNITRVLDTHMKLIVVQRALTGDRRIAAINSVANDANAFICLFIGGMRCRHLLRCKDHRTWCIAVADEAFGSVLSTYSRMLFTCLRISVYFFIYFSPEHRTRTGAFVARLFFTSWFVPARTHTHGSKHFVFRVQKKCPCAYRELQKGNAHEQRAHKMNFMYEFTYALHPSFGIASEACPANRRARRNSFTGQRTDGQCLLHKRRRDDFSLFASVDCRLYVRMQCDDEDSDDEGDVCIRHGHLNAQRAMSGESNERTNEKNKLKIIKMFT